MSRVLPSSPALAGGGARPLRVRLGIAFAILIFAASLLLAGALAAYAKREFLSLARENVEALSTQMARELSSGMDRFAREIELQASGPVFSDRGEPVATLRLRLEAIQTAYPEFAYISVVDAQTATVLAATGGIFEGGSGKGRPAFEEGKKGLFVADVHEAVKLANLLPRPASGEPLRFLDVAAPIRDANGNAFRVLGAHLSWQWTQSIKRSVLAPVESSRKVQLMLVDSDGRVALPPDSSIAVGAPLAQAMGLAATDPSKPWADGRAYVSAEAATFATGAFKGLGWRIVARQPMSVALAPSRRLRDYFLGGGLLLGALAGALAWVLAGRIVRPVSDLASAAERLGPGSMLPAAEKEEPQEVVQVRAAFHRVAGEALRRAESLLDELNAIYAGAPVALAVIDREGRYLRANRVWGEAFAGPAEVAPGSPVACPGAPSSLAEAVRRASEAETPLAEEIETLVPGAPSRAWQAVFAPLRDDSGAVKGVSAVATDVTAIRRAEQELRLADKRKDEFVSMLAHELRNPLAPIVNALEILDRRPGEEQAERMRSMIRKQAKLMARLVDDLLDVARVNLGKISLRLGPVSLREVCEGAVDSQRHLLEARRQRLEVSVDDGLPELRADRSRLEQVVCNLLGNAIKYGRDGGRVALAARLDADHVSISVEDDGKGIAPEFLPRVFELFAQEEPGHGGSQGGLGIGLALVRKLVELHGGTVEAFSEGPAKGSRFVVRLPVTLEPGSAAESLRESASAK